MGRVERMKDKLLSNEFVREILDGFSGREVDSASFVAANRTLTTEELIGCGVRLLYRRGRKERRKECEERGNENGEIQTS